jgi:ketosteroid isomerase-like protein
MSNDIDFIREWLDTTTQGPEEKFVASITDDVLMRFPYIPAGMGGDINGVEHATTVFREVWKGFPTFEWHDVVIKKIEGEDYYVTTGRSTATRPNGDAYANDYVLLTRLQDGKVCEHIEYFNPAAVS